MLTDKELKKIGVDLFEVGIGEDIRTKIRKAKICIIDNQIDDLKSLHDSLKAEGFSNLNKFKKSPAINEILNAHYDVVLLDLNDVANEISADDGLGVLKLLKEREPSLPILVVTGQNIPPEARDTINLADLLSKKPVYAADLANDVDTLLKSFHDKFWGSLLLLQEMNKIDIELRNEMGFVPRIKMNFLRRSIEKKLVAREPDIVVKLEKALKLLRVSKSGTSAISKLIENFLHSA